MDIGSKVKRLRQANGLTLEDILKLLGTNLQEFF